MNSNHSLDSNSSSSSSATNNSSESRKRSNSIVCTEVFNKEEALTEGEVHEYARKIGINVETEKHLIHIAKEGLLQKLPPQWKPCWDENLQDFYYFNFESGETQWNHPLDEVFKNKVLEARKSETPNMDLRSGKLMPLPPVSKLKPLNGANPLPPLKNSKPLETKSLGKKSLPRKNNKSFESHKDSDSDEVIQSLDTTLSSGSGSPMNVKGILKTKDAGRSNLRKELLAKDEKRIIFDLDKNIEFSLNNASKQKNNATIRDLESREEDEATSGDDFMERHGLFDVSHLTGNYDEEPTKKQESSSSNSSTSKDQLELFKSNSHQGVDKAKDEDPVIKNFGSDVSYSLEKDDVEPTKEESSDSILKGNDILKTIKFPSGTLKELEERRAAIAAKATPKSQDIKAGLHQIGSPLLKKEEPKENISTSSQSSSVIPKPRKRGVVPAATPQVVTDSEAMEQMKENIKATLEREKMEAESMLKREFEKNLTDLKLSLERERSLRETELQKSFENELNNIRQRLAMELENQKSKMLDSFQQELLREGEKIDEQRHIESRNLKEEFQSNLQSDIAAYRSSLREEFNQEKKSLEADMKRQYESEISGLKAQILERIPPRETSSHPTPKVSNWMADEPHHFGVQHKPKQLQNKLVQQIDEMKGRLKADFAKQVQDLEIEIDHLRSKIKSEVPQSGYSKSRSYPEQDADSMDPGNSSSDEDMHYANIRKRRSKMRKNSALHRSTPNLDQSSDLDSAVYESSYQMDLNRSFQNLQQRVFSLERCLVPFTQPSYPIQNPIRMLTAQRHIGTGGPTITKTSIVGDRSHFVQGDLGPWTIEEQLFKSKMWLKNRSQKSTPTDSMRDFRPY